MSQYSRVVWSEGMFLRPQHFQQQERFWGDQQGALHSLVEAYGWGVLTLDIDDGMLNLGKLALRDAVLVLPDFTVVRMPAKEPLPAPLQVPAGIRDEVVYLALAVDKTKGLNIGSGRAEEGVTRYRWHDEEVIDNSVGQDASDTLQVAKLALSLRFASDDLTGYVTMPLCRIREVGEEGTVRLDKRYIPPSLCVHRNDILTGMLTEVVGMLKQRADVLASRLSQAQAAVSSLSDFLFLQLLNRYEAVLLHLKGIGQLHPERLYAELVALVGELATFVQEDKRPPQLPSYRHDQLTEVFGNLLVVLNQSLSTVLEQTATQLTMTISKFGIRVAELHDKKMLRDAQFVLAVRADMAVEELRKHMPAQIKIGPVELIRTLVNNQIPGVAIAPLPVAPREVPYHAGYHYFQLEKNSEYWERLSSSGGIAIHLSGEYPALDMELWAIAG
ncbi:type VI secretion system baseplate subunit TssK [Pokkaliibacter plantistimulans]|uniref:Type VI secretion system baseplate subunit TssK n=1 Tax=Proteobacteria bacterium 228 TaxID=2083153 RepID=A0A2S5KP07_9PROT|nr:type VI secretion system baseplate subunit TssK [Pokkaliibacter plantistimulans]PPC76269.1 type VI secretion system baseplate subunit TssK [Pokkaliibacter plantistimulans]